MTEPNLPNPNEEQAATRRATGVGIVTVLTALIGGVAGAATGGIGWLIGAVLLGALGFLFSQTEAGGRAIATFGAPDKEGPGTGTPSAPAPGGPGQTQDVAPPTVSETESLGEETTKSNDLGNSLNAALTRPSMSLAEYAGIGILGLAGKIGIGSAKKGAFARKVAGALRGLVGVESVKDAFENIRQGGSKSEQTWMKAAKPEQLKVIAEEYQAYQNAVKNGQLPNEGKSAQTFVEETIARQQAVEKSMAQAEGHPQEAQIRTALDETLKYGQGHKVGNDGSVATEAQRKAAEHAVSNPDVLKDVVEGLKDPANMQSEAYATEQLGRAYDAHAARPSFGARVKAAAGSLRSGAGKAASKTWGGLKAANQWVADHTRFGGQQPVTEGMHPGAAHEAQAQSGIERTGTRVDFDARPSENGVQSEVKSEPRAARTAQSTESATTSDAAEARFTSEDGQKLAERDAASQARAEEFGQKTNEFFKNLSKRVRGTAAAVRARFTRQPQGATVSAREAAATGSGRVDSPHRTYAPHVAPEQATVPGRELSRVTSREAGGGAGTGEIAVSSHSGSGSEQTIDVDYRVVESRDVVPEAHRGVGRTLGIAGAAHEIKDLLVHWKEMGIAERGATFFSGAAFAGDAMAARSSGGLGGLGALGLLGKKAYQAYHRPGADGVTPEGFVGVGKEMAKDIPGFAAFTEVAGGRGATWQMVKGAASPGTIMADVKSAAETLQKAAEVAKNPAALQSAMSTANIAKGVNGISHLGGNLGLANGVLTAVGEGMDYVPGIGSKQFVHVNDRTKTGYTVGFSVDPLIPLSFGQGSVGRLLGAMSNNAIQAPTDVVAETDAIYEAQKQRFQPDFERFSHLKSILQQPVALDYRFSSEGTAKALDKEQKPLHEYLEKDSDGAVNFTDRVTRGRIEAFLDARIRHFETLRSMNVLNRGDSKLQNGGDYTNRENEALTEIAVLQAARKEFALLTSMQDYTTVLRGMGIMDSKGEINVSALNKRQDGIDKHALTCGDVRVLQQEMRKEFQALGSKDADAQIDRFFHALQREGVVFNKNVSVQAAEQMLAHMRPVNEQNPDQPLEIAGLAGKDYRAVKRQPVAAQVTIGKFVEGDKQYDIIVKGGVSYGDTDGMQLQPAAVVLKDVASGQEWSPQKAWGADVKSLRFPVKFENEQIYIPYDRGGGTTADGNIISAEITVDEYNRPRIQQIQYALLTARQEEMGKKSQPKQEVMPEEYVPLPTPAPTLIGRRGHGPANPS